MLETEGKTGILGGGPVSFLFSEIIAHNVDSLLLWVPEKQLRESLARERKFTIFDSIQTFRPEVEFTNQYSDLHDTSVIIIALPSRQLEDIVEHLLYALPTDQPRTIVVLTHGLCSARSRRKYGTTTFSQFIAAMGRETGHSLQVAVASGPSILSELAASQHAFLDLAGEPETIARIEPLFRAPNIHCNRIQDPLAAELGGVLKNPVAIACGLADGLPGCGSNFQGELVKQGFMEMIRFCQAHDVDLEKMLGRSTLADLLTTSLSPGSRNRAFGRQFIRQLESISLLDRFEALFFPRQYIEKQAGSTNTTVEGAYALSLVLEIATEKKLELPLFQTLFDILSRKKSPAALLEQVTGRSVDKTTPRRSRQPGLSLFSGSRFQSALQKRIYRNIINTAGLIARIRKQAAAIIPVLQRRLSKARQKKQDREMAYLPQEIRLWQELDRSKPGQERSILEQLIDFYIHEISDHYSPAIRAGLVRLLGPLRFLIGGLRPGAGLPFVRGAIKELKQAARHATIFYVPTHKSHLDSVEIAFGLTWAGLPVPRYAAGINLMTGKFLAGILKALGAYAVDREKTRNFLYLECLNAYATVMLEAGIPSLVYAEGTRSRSGGFGTLKTGLLSTAIEAYRNSGTEVCIVPLAVSYENVPEDLEFTASKKKPGWIDFLRVRSRVYIDIGRPLPVSEFLTFREPTGELASAILKAWQDTSAILPNHIVAALVENGDTAITLEQKIQSFLSSHNGNFLLTSPHRIVNEGLRVLRRRKIIALRKKKVRVIEPALLRYYGEMIPDRS